jgi:hypothetical protein
MKPAVVVLLLSACAPTLHKLPSNALSYAGVIAADDRMRVELRPVTAATWVDGHDPTLLLRWRERRLYAPLPGPVPEDRQAWVALVPRPSLEVTIHNDSDQPLSFERAEIRVNDDHGGRYAIATSALGYLRDLIGPMMIDSPALWLARLRWGPVEQWPTALTTRLGPRPSGLELPVAAAIRAAAEQVPLFGTGVVVPPHGAWSGALVFDTDAGAGEALASRLRGNLYVSWRGARFGEESAQPFVASLPLDARITGEDCMQQLYDPGIGHFRVVRPMAIDGMAVTRIEANEEMIGLSASRADALRARRMRVAGGVLIGAGLFASVGSPAAIALSDRAREAPAGVSWLALTAIGAALNYVGVRHEREAMARYNGYMRETGACAAPR